MEILKIVFLFIAVLFIIANSIRIYYKNDVPFANIFYNTIGITGFIYLQWMI